MPQVPPRAHIITRRGAVNASAPCTTLHQRRAGPSNNTQARTTRERQHNRENAKRQSHASRHPPHLPFAIRTTAEPAPRSRATASPAGDLTPAVDETRERADPESRPLPPRDDPEAGDAKDLVSLGRDNREPTNRTPELRGKHARRPRARHEDLDAPGASQAIESCKQQSSSAAACALTAGIGTQAATTSWP
jgi:hypothetical protein